MVEFDKLTSSILRYLSLPIIIGASQSNYDMLLQYVGKAYADSFSSSQSILFVLAVPTIVLFYILGRVGMRYTRINIFISFLIILFGVYLFWTGCISGDFFGLGNEEHFERMRPASSWFLLPGSIWGGAVSLGLGLAYLLPRKPNESE